MLFVYEVFIRGYNIIVDVIKIEKRNVVVREVNLKNFIRMLDWWLVII